ncbi:NAD-dependent epimerase/dehydratase family protein [Undibacterium fentianense]|uniref:NAD-dependent epimerase/dehydratase family protein n=1 Tax=Undibacterium fentianense TaxID=2828728 RepID=A0A941E6Y6_9BURK|nr:NAD-dependent epimerase/dehydratase family protein [Undibacterium fentianense]MBR7799853.1 NAD-dependent epimerase/dehydratase family protein [Undibacterium fentianense]
MSQLRRQFLQIGTAASVAGVTGVGLASFVNAQQVTTNMPYTAQKSSTPKRILILGGTGFLGPAIVAAATVRGHTLTLFNRGKTRPGLFPDIEKRQGDRDPNKGEGIKSLETGEWDAVIDDSGYFPRMVGASAQLLASRVKQYIYISSISCYKEPVPMHGDEDTPLASLSNPAVEEMGKNFENYGGLKAACEQAAEKALPGRTTVVRPGYIVGPDDPTGRFTYWPVRFDQGGEIAVPGAPTEPFQVIDVRDLAEWLVMMVEHNTTGRFNALGPEKTMPWGRVVEACKKATKASSSLTWIPSEFMDKQSDIEFPIWSPYYGNSKGFHTWSNARAVKAAMRFRPIEQTVADTLAWYKTQLSEEKGRVKIAFSAEQEATILKRWKDSKGS